MKQTNEELLTIFEELEGELITFAEARKLVEELLIEALLNEHHFARNSSYGNPTTQFMSLSVREMDKRLSELNAQLDGLKGE